MLALLRVILLHPWTCSLKSVYGLREKETRDFVYVTQFNNQLCSLNLALLLALFIGNEIHSQSMKSCYLWN